MTEDIQDTIVTIYFSKNRPLQLDLCLYSNRKCSSDWDIQNEVVIYKATNSRFEHAYKTVSEDHKSVTFVEEKNFKVDLLRYIRGKKYVLFVVDDCIFTHKYSVIEMVRLLEDEALSKETLGFSLRLGLNTKKCYPINRENNIPNFIKGTQSNILKFNWTTAGVGDFSYPLEVSSSLYRVQDIQEVLELCDYTSPNLLEWVMYFNLDNFKGIPHLLCYKTSVAFCNPINKVKKENNNRAGKKIEYTLNNLLEKYEKGERGKYKSFSNFISTGCHQEVPMEFTRQKQK